MIKAKSFFIIMTLHFIYICYKGQVFVFLLSNLVALNEFPRSRSLVAEVTELKIKKKI